MAAIPAYDLGQVVSVLQHGLDPDFQAVVLEVGDGQDVQRARALTAPAVILVWSDGASADDQGRLVCWEAHAQPTWCLSSKGLLEAFRLIRQTASA